jgi:hypothetical protein
VTAALGQLGAVLGNGRRKRRQVALEVSQLPDRPGRIDGLQPLAELGVVQPSGGIVLADRLCRVLAVGV